eukprot:jgi/Psemu1/283318/fgenesh1_pg.24_\
MKTALTTTATRSTRRTCTGVAAASSHAMVVAVVCVFGMAMLATTITTITTTTILAPFPATEAFVVVVRSSSSRRRRVVAGSKFRNGNHGLSAASNDETNDDDESGVPVPNLLKDTSDLVVGDWIVAKRDVPSLGIRAGAVYKLVSMYLKGSGDGDGLGVEVLPLDKYGDSSTPRAGSYTTYLRVWNPRDHGDKNNNDGEEEEEAATATAEAGAGVVVTPDEIGLVSLKADWTEAALLAVPGFVWVVVAISFSNYYTDRYGGSFWDAFFRT